MKRAETVTIGFVQYDVQKDIRENIKRVSELLEGKHADLFVLPELSDRGYLCESRRELLRCADILEENELVRSLRARARERDCAFAVGIAERCGEDVYNSAALIDRGAIAGVYRKIHLSDLEKSFFKPGTRNETFRLGEVTVGVQICFDLWFPEISREQLLRGADIFCALANFGGKTTCEIARIRAVENLTPLVLCNRVGDEKNARLEARFLGRSSVWGMDGSRLENGADGSEVCAVCEVDLPRGRGNAISSDMMAEVQRHYSRPTAGVLENVLPAGKTL